MPARHPYTPIEQNSHRDGSSHPLPPPLESARGEEEDGDGTFFLTFIRTRSARHVLVLALLISVGSGSVASAVPGLLGDRFARLEFGYDGPSCSELHDEGREECRKGGDAAQNAAASAAFVENMLMLVFSSVVGSASDCRGRKAFLAASFALLVTTPLSLVLIQLFDEASPYWYYCSRASHGLVSSFTLCLTVLSDVMPPEMRSPSYGLFLATYLLGFAFSQVLAKLLSHTMVAIVAAGLLQIGVIFVTLVLQETLPEEARKKAMAKRREEDGGWGRVVLRPISELSILNRNKFFRLLAVVSLCSGMIYSSDTTLIIYYMKNQLDIGYQSISTMLLVQSLVGVLVQIFLLKFVIGCLREKRSLVLGLVFGAVHNYLWGISSSQTGIFAGMIISQFAGIHFPILVGMRSANVGEDEQGRVQGAFFCSGSNCGRRRPSTFAEYLPKNRAHCSSWPRLHVYRCGRRIPDWGFYSMHATCGSGRCYGWVGAGEFGIGAGATTPCPTKLQFKFHLK